MTPVAPRLGGAALVALLYAGLALASGLDRFSATSPGFVRLVPQAFRVEALKVEATGALGSGRLAQADALASRSVARDPLDARALSLLASTRLLRGTPDAEAAFAVAAQLGWRDPLAQAYWFGRTMEQGDVARAAIRLDALLRAAPDFPAAQSYIAMLEASPAGRAALAGRLRGDARWASAYAAPPDGDDAMLRSRADFLAGQARSGLDLGCDGALPLVRELARRNFRANADRLLAAQCPAERPAGAIADAEFDRFGEAAPSGLGWRREGGGDVRLTPVGGKDRGVEIANRASVTRLVLAQPVALSAGPYRVTGRIPRGGRDRLVASLDCGTPVRPLPSARSIAPEGSEVTAPGCPDQVLGLWLRPGPGAVTVEAIAVTPRRPR